ncbi:MAG: XrtA system polysaccharide deacetylase [Pseudomonadota bacterium]
MPTDILPPRRTADGRILNGMSVDVEEYFQVGAFEGCIARADWSAHESRVVLATERILALLASAGVKATFFCLGWVAERQPALIRRIVAQGHELASHGYDHRRVFTFNEADFRNDVRRTHAVLEDVAGVGVRGYRAPSFSIDHRCPWAHDVLLAEGYAYSSSVYPIRHDHYGMPEAPRFAFRPMGKGIVEVPMSTVEFAGKRIPCSGGGFFRLFPYGLSRALLRRLNERDRASGIFYLHPWEVDAEQPVQRQAPLKSRLRHYVNLATTADKLARLLADFAWDRMDRVFLAPATP